MERRRYNYGGEEFFVEGSVGVLDALHERLGAYTSKPSEWIDTMRRQRETRVVDSVIKEEHEVGLGWLKSFVCRVFRITHERWFWYLLRIEIQDSLFGLNDILIDGSGNLWKVTGFINENSKVLFIRGMRPLPAFRFGTTISLYASTFSEKGGR